MGSKNKIPNNEIEILIVEDSPTQALNLQHLLEKNNYKVSAARNGLEALDFVDKKKPTLIISDIVMPGMDGLELCRNIKTDENLKDIPILILSALSDPEDIIQGLSNGADNFLTKPYEEKILLSRIEYVLVNRNMRKNRSSDLGIEIYFAGKKYLINSDRLQILDLLFSTYDNAMQRSRELESKNKELEAMQEELKELNAKLEQKVIERTQKIRQLNSIILAVRNVNQLICRERNLNRLIQSACDNLISTKSFSSAWIILKDKSGKLTGASDSGLSKTFIRRLKQLTAGDIPACFEKVLDDEGVVYLKEGQSNCEICTFDPVCSDKVLIAVRLEHGNNTYGFLTVALEEGAIPEKEGIGLLKEVAGDIAFALHSIELEEKRKHLQEKVYESEKRYRALFENAPVGICISTSDGAIETKNETMRILTGYSLEESWLLNTADLCSNKQDHQEIFEILQKQGCVRNYLAQVKRKDGTDFFANININRISYGGEEYFIIFVEDLSERVMMQEQLRQLAKFPAENPDPVLRVDKEGRIIYANKSSELVLNTWGCAEGDLLPVEMHRLCLEGLKTGLNQTAESKCAESDFLFLFAPIVESGYVNLYGREITKLRQAEEGRRLLETAIEQAAEYILITDAEGTIQYVNQAFEKITGFKREEAIGQNPRILKSGVQNEAFYRDMWDTIKGGEVWKGHLVNKKKDGNLYTEEATISPVRNPSGQITNFVAVKRDVTQELNLENQLRHAQKMESIGQLTGGVAHDFNNILTTIMGYSSLVKKAPELSEKIRKQIEEMEKASMRGAELTRQLLTFSRKQTPRLETINLNDVIDSTLGFLKRTLPPTIVIESKLSPDLGPVSADSGQMQQILMNLCVNSHDAMPGGGKIRIETENIVIEKEYIRNHYYAKPGPFVLLTFSDTGEGMNKEDMSRIFEPFFTTKALGKGTGLGLSIVYGIVKNHKGFINVYSEKGKGTTFKIYLPQTTGRVKAKSEVEQAIKGGNETVLVVEDEDMILKLVFCLLGELGYKCYTASNGLEGLKVYQEKGGEIDLAILDVVMPKMNGPELFAEIRKINPEAKVIISSGFSLENEDDLLAQGVKAFIPKPYQIKVLARTVRKVLDRKT